MAERERVTIPVEDPEEDPPINVRDFKKGEPETRVFAALGRLSKRMDERLRALEIHQAVMDGEFGFIKKYFLGPVEAEPEPVRPDRETVRPDRETVRAEREQLQERPFDLGKIHPMDTVQVVKMGPEKAPPDELLNEHGIRINLVEFMALPQPVRQRIMDRIEAAR